MFSKIVRIITASVLSLVLISSLFGCSKTEDNTAGKTTAGTKAATAAGTQTSTEAKPEIIEYKFMSYATVPPADPNNTFASKLINEKFNVKINYEVLPVDMGQASEKVKILAATNTLPDVLWLPSLGGNLDLVKMDLLLPLDDLLSKYGQNLLKTANDVVLNVCKVDGKMYGVPGMDRQASNALYARKDWLDKLGLKEPKTLDEFHDMLKAFTFNDPDGNGKKDTYGYGERNNFDSHFSVIYLAFGVTNNSWIEYEGKLYYAQTHPKAKDALAVLQQWYKEGIIDPEFLTTNTDAWFQKLGIGKLGVVVAGVFSHKKVNDLVKATTPSGSLTKIEPPVGPDGKSGLVAYGGIVNPVVISKKAKSPERLIQIFDWMTTEEAAALINYGEEGKHYKVNPGVGVEMLISEDEQKKLGLTNLTGRFYNPIRPNTMFFDKFTTEEDLKGFKIAEKHMFLSPTLGISMAELIKDMPSNSTENLFKGILSIITGNEPPEAIQKYADQWYDNGGRKLTEDVNNQWNQMKK